jgi:hypothetical protein
MLSDSVGSGTFHRHDMRIGGKSAKPARTVQLETECRLPAKPTVNAAETQMVDRPALSDMSCIPEAYAPRADGAVPE